MSKVYHYDISGPSAFGGLMRMCIGSWFNGDQYNFDKLDNKISHGSFKKKDTHLHVQKMVPCFSKRRHNLQTSFLLVILANVANTQ